MSISPKIELAGDNNKERSLDIVYTNRILARGQFSSDGSARNLELRPGILRFGAYPVFGNSGLMNRFLATAFFGTASLLSCCSPELAWAQTPADSVAAAKQGIALAQKGNCKQAIPILKKLSSGLKDPQMRYEVAMSTARCAMSLDQTETAVQSLLLLNREFPRDPAVLYSTTHFYSELAARASQELATIAPSSVQARELEAEGFESQSNWEMATAQYRKILEQSPNTPDVHYRLGRILLSKDPPDSDAASKEFQAELKVNPENASAEFMLGEIDRRAGQWDGAIGHFSRASHLDQGFAEAYLALGISLNSSGKFSEAVAPLQSYVKMVPDDPAGHYQLATAFARTGRKPEAEREMALQKETAAKSPRTEQR